MSLIRFMPPRGTNAQCNAYVGTLGELFVDTNSWQLRVSDGATVGGHVQGGISNLVGCSDVTIASAGPAYADGQYLRWGAGILAAPVQSNTATSTSGGTLAAATYYYVVTALNAQGETLKSNEKSQVTTGSASKNTISWGSVSGATGYRVYRGTSAGTENVYWQLGAVTTYVDDGTAGTAGSLPTDNTTGSWQNAALAWADLTGTPTTLSGYGITNGVINTRQVIAGSGLSGGGDLSADRTLAVATNGVTNAMLGQMAANSIKGNNTGSAANAADLTTAQVKSLLAIASTDVSGLAASATTDTTNAANISAGALPAGRLPALTGDVTTSVGTVGTTIAAAAVTLAKMANLAANSIIGNNTGSVATPLALSASQVKTLLAIGTADISGLAAYAPTWTSLHTYSPSTGRAVQINANSATTALEIDGAASSFASLLLKSGQTGTRAFELISGQAADNFDIWDDTLGASRFQIQAATNKILGRGPSTAGLVDMTPDGGTFTGTLTGCTTSPTNTCVWARIGNLVTLWIPALTATSNSTSGTITGLPAAIQPTRAQNIPFMVLDASVAAMGGVQLNASSGTISLLKNLGGATGYSATMTSSGTKGSGSGVIHYLLN